MRPTLSLFFLLLFLYLLTFGGHFYVQDEEIQFRVTESLALRGSLAIDPIALGFGTRPPGTPRDDGRQFAQYGVGQPLAAVPFYWLGRGLGNLAGDEFWMELNGKLRTIQTVVDPLGEMPGDASSLSNPRGVAARLGVSLFNPLVTALSGLFLFLLARRLSGSVRAAWLAALLWGAGSIAWPHGRMFFSEPLAGLCLLVGLEMLARFFYPFGNMNLEKNEDEEQIKLACGCLHQCSCGRGGLGCRTLVFFAGLAAGYGCLVRLDSVFFLPALTLLAAFGDVNLSRKAEGEKGESALRFLAKHLFSGTVLRRLALFLLPVAGAGATVLLLNAWQYGSFFASGYSDQTEGIHFSTPILKGLYGFFMSIGKGMFFFSPTLILALWGIRPMLRRRPAFGGAILLAFVSFLCVMSKWQNWSGGWDWGPRHIVQIQALLAIPIAFWIAESWSAFRRVTIGGLLALGMMVQVYACSQSPFEFFHVFYRDPAPPRAHALYNQNVFSQNYVLYQRDPHTGKPVLYPTDPVTELPFREIPTILLVAPFYDSTYIFEDSVWPGYAALWREREVHDFFWIHLLR